MSDKPNQKKNKTIRSLERKAEKGDILASFQLSEYYTQGKYVNQDQLLAEKYRALTLKGFADQKLEISSVKLVNFRGYDHVALDLSSQEKSSITVFIGNNGAGKTALLESISMSLSWLIRRIVSSGGNGDFIDHLDIKNTPESEYASIITNFKVTHAASFTLELSKSREGSNSTRNNQIVEIGQLADIYKLANSNDPGFNFPIMAYYSVERAMDISNKDLEAYNELTDIRSLSKFEGYSKTLAGTADFKQFFRWYKYLEDICNEALSSDDSFLNALQKFESELRLDFLKEYRTNLLSKASDDDLIEKYKEYRKKHFDDIKKKIPNENTGSEAAKKIITHIKDAISIFIPEFSNLRVERHPTLDMKVDKNQTALSVLQLSQGERSLMALVADITRRLILLNPSLENPLLGSGIVLIDEIDLHLHPEWQQSVIPGLTSTFPNIQFFITTHSPQVISTVESKSIRIIRDNKFHTAPKGSKGAKSSRVMTRYFEVDARPKNDPVAIDLKRYLDLVYQDQWNCGEALSLREKLNSEFGNEEPELTEADLYIETREWELSNEEDL